MASIVLGPTTFNVQPLFASDSFDLQPRILPLLTDMGQAWAALVDASGGKAENLKGLDVADLGPLLTALAPVVERSCKALPRGELKLLLRDVLRTTTTASGALLFGEGADGGQRSDPFDILMQGRTLDTWKLLTFALKVHYPDFFGALAAFGGAAKATTANPSGGSTTSPSVPQATA